MASRGRMRGFNPDQPRDQEIDLASPAGASPFDVARGKHKSTVRLALDPEPSFDDVLQGVIPLLKVARPGQAIAYQLRHWGVTKSTVNSVLGLMARGTAHRPNARLVGHGVSPTPEVREVRDTEVYYRAAYIINAAKRVQKAIDDGQDFREALRRENVYYQGHERARRARLDAVAQVQDTAHWFGIPTPEGTLVGWYLNPLLNNDTECILANGRNFIAENGTAIGLPGSVHPGCGCYAGPPHTGAGLVNDALRGVRVLHGRKARPFKLKGRTA